MKKNSREFSRNENLAGLCSDFNDPVDKSADKSSQIDKFYHVNGK